MPELLFKALSYTLYFRRIERIFADVVL